jgi:hypothetical protein
MRAFLQRGEVRLSTLHRVASALLSGAGIMVLLPTIERDALATVGRKLLSGDLDAARLLVVLAAGAALLLPMAALWLLLKELTRFYFHAEHHTVADGSSMFLPRYTLTALRLPSDELSPQARAVLDDLRGDEFLTRLIVPDNDRYRDRIDEQRRRYRGLEGTDTAVAGGGGDRDRAEFLVELAAARDRALMAEVVKLEYGLARHVMRTQVLVLRYTKALLALITTAAAVFAASAAVSGDGDTRVVDVQWVAAILALWAPAVVVTVTSPVHWLIRILKSDEGSMALVRDDRELTHFEDIVVRVAVIGWLASIAALALSAADPAGSTAGDRTTLVVAVASGVALVIGMVRWDGTRVVRRLFGRHRVAPLTPKGG